MLLKKKRVTDKFDPGAQRLDNQKSLLATEVPSTFFLNEADSFGFASKDI